MAIDPQIKQQMKHTIWVAAAGVRNRAGDITFAAPVSAPCRQENSLKQVDTATESGLRTVFEIITELQVGLHDRVWPDGVDHTNNTLARTPIGVDSVTYENGVYSYTVVTI